MSALSNAQNTSSKAIRVHTAGTNRCLTFLSDKKLLSLNFQLSNIKPRLGVAIVKNLLTFHRVPKAIEIKRFEKVEVNGVVEKFDKSEMANRFLQLCSPKAFEGFHFIFNLEVVQNVFVMVGNCPETVTGSFDLQVQFKGSVSRQQIGLCAAYMPQKALISRTVCSGRCVSARYLRTRFSCGFISPKRSVIACLCRA